MNITYTSPSASLVLPLKGVRSWTFQVVLIASAVMLPALFHTMGLSVRTWLPMHWPILLAGLVYGWRSGLLVGALAPTSNWLLTGYPLPLKLLPMTLELAVYGLLAGWLKERTGMNGFLAVAIALVAGRLIFLSTIILTNAVENHTIIGFIMAAMVPGLIAGAAQIGLLPPLARILTHKIKR